MVSRSSTEAEYLSMAHATWELLWLQQLLTLHIKVSTNAKLFCDNKSVMHIATNPIFHEQTKQMEIDYHTVRDQVKKGFITLMHVSSANQHGEIMTKPLHSGPFHSILNRLSISSLFLPPDGSVSET